jgi:hypothetical protein
MLARRPERSQNVTIFRFKRYSKQHDSLSNSHYMSGDTKLL